MKTSRRIAALLGGLLGLAAGALVASSAVAMQPNPPATALGSAAAVVESWEAADGRLTALLGKAPTQARKGLERALAANREGRQNAELALKRSDEPRALRALEIASAHAEIGFNQARASMPESALPELEAVAAQMNRRRPATISGLVAAPSVDVIPPGRSPQP